MTTWRVAVVVVGAVAFFACSAPPPPPETGCSSDTDCSPGFVCQGRECVEAPPSGCQTGSSRPCGPEPVGACRKGLQLCVDGVFEADCRFAVNALPEVCNAIDDDCNGLVDDGVTETFYRDLDGDGFGSNAAGASQSACTKPSGFVTSNSDCDDSAVSINPSASERCDPAGVDENCDGTANEACACSTPGMSQACCAGRGNQTCEARDGGSSLSACTVMASAELCNGVDDDCDGQTDDQYALFSADGGGIAIDGGVIELDGGCVVGIGGCARSGSSTCTSGALSCSATAAAPIAETCNGIDDDCDGQADDGSLCSVAGQSCSAGVCNCPMGMSVCGSSCQTLGGGCSDGVGACLRTGTIACSNGSAACNAVAAAPTTEVCNGFDDDCDGQVDEASATLCAATGQSCTSGSCNCPSGQAVCGSSCQALGGSCSLGVGACLRQGTIACASGAPACNAVPGTPIAEICDGADNDCDGTNDNGVTITCYPDADGDRHATAATASAQCADPNRASFGNCPSGFVAPGASLGLDCSPSDPNLFRLLGTRADADADTFCAGADTSTCVGTTAPGGRRFSSVCSATDDCNDLDSTKYQLLAGRADADNDTYCAGATVFYCSGSSLAAGLRAAGTCAATDDCNDANAARYRLLSSRADADLDGYCVGGAANDCVGSGPLPGRRFTATCAGTDDCNDADATRFTNLQVRTDGDSDQYCINAAFTQCTGSAALPGTRTAASCLGDDCRDNNSFATTTCTVPGAFTTQYHSMACGIGLPGMTTTFVPTATICPTSFSVVNLRTEKTSGAGSCSAAGPNTLVQSCTGFDASNCRIVGDCEAN